VNYPFYFPLRLMDTNNWSPQIEQSLNWPEPNRAHYIFEACFLFAFSSWSTWSPNLVQCCSARFL